MESAAPKDAPCDAHSVEAEAKGLRIDVKAPTEECPSMPAALRDFLLKNNE